MKKLGQKSADTPHEKHLQICDLYDGRRMPSLSPRSRRDPSASPMGGTDGFLEAWGPRTASCAEWNHIKGDAVHFIPPLIFSQKRIN